MAAAGKIASAFDIARTLALGADWCNAARAFMFSLGCIQSRNCHNDHGPMLCAAGLSSPAELGPEHIVRRVSELHVASPANVYRFLQPGELLTGVPERHAVFEAFRAAARFSCRRAVRRAYPV